METIVEIAHDYVKWEKYNIKPIMITKIVKEILGRYENLKKIKLVEISILLTNNMRMRKLNNEFRGLDKPTNVLSFKDMEVNWRNLLDFKPDIDYTYLGDIAFGYEIIDKEAKDKEWSFINYFIHLLIHGIIHLIGYEHDKVEEAIIMEQLEIDILKKFNIQSPY